LKGRGGKGRELRIIGLAMCTRGKRRQKSRGKGIHIKKKVEDLGEREGST